MDPATFAATYYHALPSLTGLRYPYPATTATPGASATGRGMIFYPQPLTVEHQERQDDPKSPESPQSGSNSSKRPMDKKLRRQIANSNERRRMQSINQGFHSLRILMPHLQGEKLSKASVLQHAAEHIYRLNSERDRLLQQNTTLRMMLSKYWNSSDRPDILGENKVNKATSPMTFDDDKAAAKELEQIFTSQKELDSLKMELQCERAKRMALEARFHPSIEDQTPSEDDDLDESEGSDMDNRAKRPRMSPHQLPPPPPPHPTGNAHGNIGTRDTSPRNNLDIIVRAIRQIEGDAFSRSTTPTCAAQDRSTGTFRPISTGTDSSRVSPVTPVCAS